MKKHLEIHTLIFRGLKSKVKAATGPLPTGGSWENLGFSGDSLHPWACMAPTLAPIFIWPLTALRIFYPGPLAWKPAGAKGLLDHGTVSWKQEMRFRGSGSSRAGRGRQLVPCLKPPQVAAPSHCTRSLLHTRPTQPLGSSFTRTPCCLKLK